MLPFYNLYHGIKYFFLFSFPDIKLSHNMLFQKACPSPWWQCGMWLHIPTPSKQGRFCKVAIQDVTPAWLTDLSGWPLGIFSLFLFFYFLKSQIHYTNSIMNTDSRFSSYHFMADLVSPTPPPSLSSCIIFKQILNIPFHLKTFQYVSKN